MPPDDFNSTRDNPEWAQKLDIPGDTPFAYFPTNKGKRIVNTKDGKFKGKEVTFVGRSAKDVARDKITAIVPGLVNGLVTTDADVKVGKPGDPLDPGYLQYLALSSGVMTDNSLGMWLADHQYLDGCKQRIVHAGLSAK